MSVLALLLFTSTFDTTDHSILVHRPHTYAGFTDSILQWFSSYLTDRAHVVSLSNYCHAIADTLYIYYTIYIAMHDFASASYFYRKPMK